MSLLSAAKNLIVPKGRRPRRVLAGPFAGLRLGLDLATETQFYLGLFEKEIAPWLTRLSQDIRCFVDIGAAHGEYTLFALRKASVQAVFAFEPDPEMVGCFNHNLRLNAFEADSRLHFFDRFLGPVAGEATITSDWLTDRINAPCLLKMDIEGAEGDVLAGSRRLLSLRGLRWIIETHSKSNEVTCMSILESAGFAVRVIPNAWWRKLLPEQRNLPHNRWLVAANDGSLDLSSTQ